MTCFLKIEGHINAAVFSAISDAGLSDETRRTVSTQLAAAMRDLSALEALQVGPEPDRLARRGGAEVGGVSRVLDLLNEAHRISIKPASDRYSAALLATRTADDPAMAAVAVIVELEAIEAAAKAARDQIRDAVRDDMDESGVLKSEAGAYEVTRVVAKPASTVTDLAALQAASPDLFEPQPDKLNRTELARRLRSGEAIPGATLSNGGPGHIQIRGKK